MYKQCRVSWVIRINRSSIFQYALAYACLKLVNYSFFFWLPYYLHNKYGWKETVADDISIWYDVGGIIGKASYSCCPSYCPCLLTFFKRSSGPRNASHFLSRINVNNDVKFMDNFFSSRWDDIWICICKYLFILLTYTL